MAKYFPAYKCQLCGSVIKYGDTAEVEEDRLEGLVRYITANKTQGLSFIPHKCKDGNCGAAVFVGLKKAK